ncbi:uncharacterized protein LY79DRAFT_349168 [Colletotrichum navitas]|uniref:Uncharacterized protein n=1 Tax=Colletotrichum navitas TaxID=681940 RepID=A0AAD8Q909_9PEZI|nr:uncharacterized protein LY79DRAFT_349168 [Colletotrichum navitas]KAK1597581.1 hypothetical protein LY79DRAFT_349168 [Colletotrichum navitas]
MKRIGQLCPFPHVLRAPVSNGLFQGINTSIQTTYAGTLMKPADNWKNVSVPLIQLGQLPIVLLCVPLISWLSDHVVRCGARRHQGVHEPDKRLIAWIIPMIMTCAIHIINPLARGLVGFGLSPRTMQYLASIGSATTFGIYAAVSAVFCLLGIISYFTRKRVRRACARLTQ